MWEIKSIQKTLWPLLCSFFPFFFFFFFSLIKGCTEFYWCVMLMAAPLYTIRWVSIIRERSKFTQQFANQRQRVIVIILRNSTLLRCFRIISTCCKDPPADYYEYIWASFSRYPFLVLWIWNLFYRVLINYTLPVRFYCRC